MADQLYFYSFFLLVAVLVLLRWIISDSNSKQPVPVSNAFTRFQRNYLLVYMMVMGADWLQGPYIYSLYKYYGFAVGDIALLFVAGYAASAVFGTIAGTAADRYGRKTMCLAFAFFYSLSCITKHSGNFKVLLAGRLLGGISTSLLFSVFEAWMVHEHRARSFPDEWLCLTYATCTSGNAVVAILAGLVASAANVLVGPVGPFDVSLLLLFLATIVISITWSNNAGNVSVNLGNTFLNGVRTVRADSKIVFLGLSQSLFEAAMYIFVFMWTPALESTTDAVIDHGWVFASFMSCVYFGSGLFTLALKAGLSVEEFAFRIFLVAAFCHSVPIWSSSHLPRLSSFFAFETCVGMFWPSMGTMRSKYIPEDVRSTVMTLFRIPLNILVVTILSNVSKVHQRTVFLLSTCILLVAAFCQHCLVVLDLEQKEKTVTASTETTGAAKIVEMEDQHMEEQMEEEHVEEEQPSKLDQQPPKMDIQQSKLGLSYIKR